MKPLRALFSTCSACVLALVATAQVPSYSVELIGSTNAVIGLNNYGQMIGNYPLAPASERGWVASRTTPITPLPLPPGRVSSHVYDINDLGVIAGSVSSTTYADPSFGGIAALWIPNGSGGYTVQELSKLPGDTGSAAKAINNLGDVVGYSQGNFQRAVWFNSPTGLLDLTPTTAFNPVAINDQRMVVCYSTRCARLDLNTMVLQDLGLPVGSFSSTLGGSINESNQVAGVAIGTSSTCNRFAARYTDGIGWQVLNTCGTNNGPGNINALGDVTMWTNTSAFVRFEGLGTYRIEDLINAPVGHWFLGTLATGQINDSRQIAIYGSNPTTGQSGLLLLVPQGDVGTPTCAGDGSFGSCPCNNSSALGAGEGCAHSGGIGAKLVASGSNVVTNDDLVLTVSGAPSQKSAVFVQGFVAPPVPFADGLRCIGSPTVRLENFVTDALGAGSSSVSIVTRGFVTQGVSRNYQVWFRDPTGPCGHTSNLSSGVRVDWQ